MEEVVNVGDEIEVKVISKDSSGRIKLSRKALLDGGEDTNAKPEPDVDISIGDIITGKVVNIASFGAFVEIVPGTDGMVHISELENYRVSSVEDVVNVGDEVTVKVIDMDDRGRIKLSRKALLSD